MHGHGLRQLGHQFGFAQVAHSLESFLLGQRQQVLFRLFAQLILIHMLPSSCLPYGYGTLSVSPLSEVSLQVNLDRAAL